MRNFTQFIRGEEKARLDIHCFDLKKREGEELFEILKNLRFTFCYVESDSMLAFLTGEYSQVEGIMKRLKKHYGFTWAEDKLIFEDKVIISLAKVKKFLKTFKERK